MYAGKQLIQLAKAERLIFVAAVAVVVGGGVAAAAAVVVVVVVVVTPLVKEARCA